MDTVDIIYRIKLNDTRTEKFTFSLAEDTFDLQSDAPADPPDWTRLDYRQCEHCPLSTETHTHCPLALEMSRIVQRFDDTSSIDEVTVQVATDDRKVGQKTSLQRAIASMLDLIYPICGCPKTEFMKPLARFHLPLCSEEETVFRVTGMYMLAQYFVSRTPGSEGHIDFDGLTEIYKDLHILNSAIASRLKGATQSDSSKNAVTLVDMYSTLVPLLLEDELAEMRGFFQAYLPHDDEAGKGGGGYLDKAKAFSQDIDNLGLVPIEGSNDDMPQWMKEAKGLVEPEPVELPGQKADKGEEKPKPVVEKKKEPEPFKTSDGLTLELAPIEERSAEE